jgi:RNA 2',3'-cyclic 3'-phosphodiesterase
VPTVSPDADLTVAASARLFLALWPDETERGMLASIAPSLALRGGRIVAPHNLHVTLVFLGKVAAERRARLEQAMTSMHASRFEFALTYAEWRRKSRILWLGTDDPVPRLDDLVGGLNAIAAQCGHKPESRPYRLHLTLARDVALGPRRQAIAPIRWQARAVSLVSSRSSAQGSEYTVVRQWPLTGE